MRSYSQTLETDDRMAARYPREVNVRGGRTLTVTPMVPSDWQMLEDFLYATPESERRFFRQDVKDPERVRHWCSQLDYRNVLPILAWDGDRIVGDAVLERENSFWTSHVGTVRMLVRHEFRRLGVGRMLMRELIEVAGELGLHKLSYPSAGDQRDLQEFLTTLGFVEEARLQGYICDSSGLLHDMVLMTFDLE